MFRFGSPYYFFMLIPLAVAAWWIYRRRLSSGLLFAPVHRVPAARVSWRTVAADVGPGLFLLGLLLTIVALARPQTVFSKSRRTADAVAIQMVVDVSGSMEALDMSDIVGNRIVTARTRLDAVKDTFAQFLAQRTDDQIGLVTFGGYATTRVPLTTDHAALQHVLKGVEIPKQLLGKDGQVVNQDELLTAIGDALATASARLQHAEPKTRIVVLLSYGEQTVKGPGAIEPEDAINAAKELGIRVYTIGVGSNGAAPFWARDLFGQQTVQMAHVGLDEVLLRRIADTTGGRYFNVRNPKGLQEAMEHIDKLEKTQVAQDVYNRYHELFPWFLCPGMGGLLLGVALNMAVARRIV